MTLRLNEQTGGNFKTGGSSKGRPKGRKPSGPIVAQCGRPNCRGQLIKFGSGEVKCSLCSRGISGGSAQQDWEGEREGELEETLRELVRDFPKLRGKSNLG